MTGNFKIRFNKVYVGLIPGMIFPIVVFIILSFNMAEGNFVKEFMGKLIRMDIFTKVVSLCVVPNLLLFFIFMWKNYLYAARGVLVATMIFALFVFIAKFAI